jgi:hypothetical protein
LRSRASTRTAACCAVPVDVRAKRLARRSLARHCASQGEHLLSGTGPEGDAIGDRRRLQRPQRARCLTVGIGLGQVGLAHVLDQHAPAREHLHQPGDDGLQQRMQFVVGGCLRLDEGRRAIGTAAVHPIQHQAVQVDVEVAGRSEALDQRDGAALSLVGGELGVQQVARDHTLHHLQHWRDELRLRGQQHPQRDRERQHPLPHWHVRDDVVDQMRRRLRHAPGAARGAEPAALATEGQQLVVATLAAAKPQEPVRQDAALEEGVELVLDETRQLGASAGSLCKAIHSNPLRSSSRLISAPRSGRLRPFRRLPQQDSQRTLLTTGSWRFRAKSRQALRALAP